MKKKLSKVCMSKEYMSCEQECFDSEKVVVCVKCNDLMKTMTLVTLSCSYSYRYILNAQYTENKHGYVPFFSAPAVSTRRDFCQPATSISQVKNKLVMPHPLKLTFREKWTAPIGDAWSHDHYRCLKGDNLKTWKCRLQCFSADSPGGMFIKHKLYWC